MYMNSKQDILNAFREHLDTLMLIASCQPEYYTEKEMKADNKISIDKFLEQTVTPTLTEFEREVREKAVNLLTDDIKNDEFINNGYELWNRGLPKDRGLEPCMECGNRNKIVNYLSQLEKEKRT